MRVHHIKRFSSRRYGAVLDIVLVLLCSFHLPASPADYEQICAIYQPRFSPSYRG